MSRTRRSFSLFIDNLPPTMMSVWLWKLFKNEGRMIEAYVSRKARPNKRYLFRFVWYPKEKEAYEAINRDNGLIVEGFKMSVVFSKYQKMKSQEVPKKVQTPKPKESKVWWPAQRDIVGLLVN